VNLSSLYSFSSRPLERNLRSPRATRGTSVPIIFHAQRLHGAALAQPSVGRARGAARAHRQELRRIRARPPAVHTRQLSDRVRGTTVGTQRVRRPLQPCLRDMARRTKAAANDHNREWHQRRRIHLLLQGGRRAARAHNLARPARHTNLRPNKSMGGQRRPAHLLDWEEFSRCREC